MDSAEQPPRTGELAFSGAQMQGYFAELDDALVRVGVPAQLHLVVAGGAVIAAKSETRRTTDVDVVSDGMTALLRRCIAEVGAQHAGMREDWLNDAARVKSVDLPIEPERIFQGRVLVIDSAGDRYVLAMKLASAREIDEADCELLIRSLGITTQRELLDLIEQSVPESRKHPALGVFAAERLAAAYPERRRRRPPGGLSL